MACPRFPRQMARSGLPGQKRPERAFGAGRCRQTIDSAGGTRLLPHLQNEKTSSRALLEVFGGLHKVGYVSLRLEPDVLKAGATPYYMKKLPE
jgi:hypothetical protein